MNRKDAVVIPGKPPAVTQEELRRVGSLWDESDTLAANIRARLESGASLEPGELGVATWGQDAVTGTAGGSCISIGGIEIEPVDHLRQVRDENPDLAAEIWV